MNIDNSQTERRTRSRLMGACVLALAITLMSPFSAAWAQDFAVIVNPGAGIDSMDQSDVVRIFLGRSKTFPNGSAATPVNSAESNSTRIAFEAGVLGKDESQMKAYWAKQMFSGQGRPPEEVGQDADVLARVASDPQAIGYIPVSMVNSSVKVVFQQ